VVSVAFEKEQIRGQRFERVPAFLCDKFDSVKHNWRIGSMCIKMYADGDVPEEKRIGTYGR
jgi:hypothetical protein